MPITATVVRAFTFETGVEVDSASLNQLGEPIVTINENDVEITGGDISGLTNPIAIADGGTGQTTAINAFDALAPTTQAGDMIAFDGTDNVRVSLGASGYYLQSNGSAPFWGALVLPESS
ncbi:MAG: hypothetical protein VXZ45_03705 [Verrucomicrobiota bacterium]|nr:hypothetical protein [Verrucomicrobiota bacterium]